MFWSILSILDSENRLVLYSVYPPSPGSTSSLQLLLLQHPLEPPAAVISWQCPSHRSLLITLSTTGSTTSGLLRISLYKICEGHRQKWALISHLKKYLFPFCVLFTDVRQWLVYIYLMNLLSCFKFLSEIIANFSKLHCNKTVSLY